ncbi:MAG: class I SAM-dependent methyltransferase [Actinobacteria bacterium]|nr:class I SAM-dependent methyltransferase [Actinomycetota bacterium]
MAVRDWRAWHERYDDPGSSLAQRLAAVQQQLAAILDGAPPGPLRAISMCAGQGRDLLPVLARHPRGRDVTARLVELDPELARAARQAAAAAGLTGVEVVTGDAGLTDAYAGLVPADLVLACGVFGNVPDPDIERTIATCGQLCRSGGSVVWTRHRGEPDRVPQICDWFARREFALRWLSDPGLPYGVGVHVLTGPAAPLAAGTRMFRFNDADPRWPGPGAGGLAG